MKANCFALLVACVAVSPLARAHWQQWHHRHPWHRHLAWALPRRDALPDARITPGAISAAVTQANIHRTICRYDYTRTVRPPEQYTEHLKRRQIREYGYTDHWLRDYEEDHLIPLELGGSPTSPENLWPEPLHVVGGWGAYRKDRLENRLNHLVCRGRLSLRAAQGAIATNWIGAYRRYMSSG